MFTFIDLRMFLTFAGAAVIIMVGLRRMTRGTMLPPKPAHPGVVPGGVLFGLGWVLTGACPGVVLVQLGEGYAPALMSLAGMLVGIAIYNAMSGRVFRWDTGSCDP